MEMTGSYQLIVVDDDPGFAALMKRILTPHGYDIHCVHSGQEVIDWLKTNEADLLLLDYRLDDMTGQDVVETLNRARRRPPFIIITGEGDEQIASEMAECGAENYLIKDDALLGLLPVVLEETLALIRQRRALEQAQRQYQEYESLYRDLFDSAADAWALADDNGILIEVNAKMAELFGYSPQQLLGGGLEKLCHPDTRPAVGALVRQVLAGETVCQEGLGVKNDGTILDIEVKGNRIACHGKMAALFIIRDISERKWAEEELKLTNQQLRVSEQAVRERERRLRAIFQGSAVGIVLYDLEGRALESNSFFQRLLGYSNLELRSISFEEYLHPDDRVASSTIFEDMARGKCAGYQIEQRFIGRLGLTCWVRVTASVMKGETGQNDYIIHVIEDIGERKQAEESLRRNETKYRLLFENMLDGFAYYQIVLNEQGQPCDYVCLEINKAYESLTGLTRKDLIGIKRSELDDSALDSTFDWRELYTATALTGEAVRFEKHSEHVNRWFLISAYSPAKGYFATIIEDITYRRQIEEELRDFTSELETSNRDLENFTRLLTNDLQGQLEAIHQTVTRLHQGYGGQLDAQGRAWLDEAAQQARNIKTMLRDVMVCSRLSYHGAPFEPVDLGQMIEHLSGKYRTALAEIGGKMTVDDLPVIYGDYGQLLLMFEKLLDYAIQNRADQSLAIEITVQSGAEQWEICFRDNGCGMDSRQQEQLFDLFNRLAVNPNSGGGLSVVKKVVERHGGSIQIHSAPGAGAAFTMVFPK